MRDEDVIERNRIIAEKSAEIESLRSRLAEAEALLREGCGYIDDVPDARSGYKDRVRAFLRPAGSATVGQDCQTLAALDSEDAARFRWLCDDHADKAIRHLRDSLLERMSVMSLSAIRAAIGIHLSNVSEQAKNSHHE